MHIPEEHLYPVQAAMEQWTDGRVIGAVELESLLLFLLCVPKVYSQLGIQIKGHVVRQKQGQTLLTVKATEGAIPLIVFITAPTTMGCVMRFMDLMEDDKLTWVKDRYPWI